MDQQIKKLIKPLVIAAVIIFALCCAYQKPTTWDDYSSYGGYAVSGVTLLFVAYDLWLWKLNPLEDTPVLEKKYDGIIRFKNKRASGEKNIKHNSYAQNNIDLFRFQNEVFYHSFYTSIII